VRPITRDEIAPLEVYAELRDAYRAAVIAHKRDRRLPVGEKVTLVFEDRETLRFQVQEMVWIERISESEKVQDEIDVYNELMPGEDELSATLFIEITDLPEIRPELDRLIGIDEHVALLLGSGTDEESIPARFDPKQFEEDRISAVQYVRFRLQPPQRERFADLAVPARVRIDHPGYRREVALPEPVRHSLVASLRREPAPLLPWDAGRRAAERDEVLAEDERVRVIRPARPRGPGHRVVEPRDPGGALLEGDPELLLALLEALRGAAEEVIREHGRARVQADLGGEGAPARWHVFATAP
jgi:hypothetical protein